MKKLIQQLEVIGQTTSLKQHASLKELLESGNFSVDLINNTLKNSKELICAIEPEDEPE